MAASAAQASSRARHVTGEGEVGEEAPSRWLQQALRNFLERRRDNGAR